VQPKGEAALRKNKDRFPELAEQVMKNVREANTAKETGVVLLSPKTSFGDLDKLAGIFSQQMGC
jgi:hypothetical protein